MPKPHNMLSFCEACYRAVPFIVRGEADREYAPFAREIKMFLAVAYGRTLEQVEMELKFWREYDANGHA